MNTIAKILALTTILLTPFTHCCQFTIRRATHDDLPTISKLDKKVMFEHFKPTIMAGYAESPTVQNEFLLDSFLNAYVHLRTIEFSKGIDSLDSHLLVASSTQNSKKIYALCLFDKRDKQLYINHIIVAQKNRRQGIGTMLLTRAINTYNDVTSCELYTLAYANERVHGFYEKYGFTSTKELVTIDPRTPNTHIIYHLDINK